MLNKCAYFIHPISVVLHLFQTQYRNVIRSLHYNHGKRVDKYYYPHFTEGQIETEMK